MRTIQGQKYLWKLPESDQKTVLQIASHFNLSVPIAQILVSRGLTDFDAINSYLFSSFEQDVAHPSRMKGAQKTIDRIFHAIKHKEKILVFGDYDVDGITSSAMMMRCLLPLGADINFYLPHRVKDGYGISSKIVKRAAENNYKVIITVDNGITAFEPAAIAKELGVDLIITDHHRPHGKIPDAYAIVNPNQVDCPYPFKSLAGVGVTFKLLCFMYEVVGKDLPPKVYELLLLGTIADVVPLLGENRFWVRHGLQYVNTTESFALKVLKQNGKVTRPQIKATDVGFGITPQINALGRLEDPRQGVKFLIGDDQDAVQQVGNVLLELNLARRTIERSIFEQVQAEIESKKIDLDKENVILAASDNWPPGVIGLVASRLVSAYGRPTLLFHLTKKGIAKGSCRSIKEFNMFDALELSKEYITQFGGHSLAAGLSLPIDQLGNLKQSLEKIVAEQLTEEDLTQKMVLDAQVQLPDLTKKFVGDMNHLEPFGNANETPKFYVKGASLVQEPKLLKDAHVKCNIFADGVIKPVIFFNRPELFEQLQNRDGKPFDIAATVSENHWNGRTSIELIGIDVAGV